MHIARLVWIIYTPVFVFLWPLNCLPSPSQGDAETLKKYCSPEVIERCTAELAALKGHDLFFDHKVKIVLSNLVHTMRSCKACESVGFIFFCCVVQILHISEVEVEETKMMGTTPTIIVRVNDFFFFF